MGRVGNIVTNLLRGVGALMVPCVCRLCGNTLNSHEHEVCRLCLDELPKTSFEKDCNNPLAERMEGRIRLTSSFAGYYFRKGENLRLLIHDFKYRGNRAMARELGRELGRRAIAVSFTANYDYLIPVPLHPSKERQRGYNQSLIIAEGIADVTGLKVRSDVIRRTTRTETQTHKKLMDRYLNISHGFCLDKGSREMIGKRLLLVDDVFTTGATTEACLTPLMEIEGVSLGLITLAYVEG